MKRLLNTFSQLLLVLVLGISLSGCVTTHVPTASTSPWQAEDLDTQATRWMWPSQTAATATWWAATG